MASVLAESEQNWKQAEETCNLLDQEQISEEREAELDRLAKLSRIEYDTERETAAQTLGVRTQTLDKEIKERRRKNGTSSAQGIAPQFESPEPWGQPVNGAELLNDIAAVFREYLAIPDKADIALALWVLHTHCFDCFEVTPRLNITAPEKGCGKTLTLDVLQTLVPKGLRTENLSTAVLFRIIQEYGPTLLVDEYDSFLRGNEELRGALNAGHRRGGQIFRCEGDTNEVRGFKTFAPVALAGIRDLPGTLKDRSIVIQMSKAKAGEIVSRFDSRHTELESNLQRMAARWAIDNDQALRDSDPELPEGVYNREADNWRPLAAIAEIVDGEWPKKLREAMNALRDVAIPEDSAGVMLLSDLRDVFNVDKSEEEWRDYSPNQQLAIRDGYLPSHDVAAILARMEDRPWPEWGRARKEITPNQLAKVLKPFGVRPQKLRRAGITAGTRCYTWESLREPCARYLPSQSATVPQPSNGADFRRFRTATGKNGVAAQNFRNPANNAACGGVAHREPLGGHHA